jgi:hypothetical protein
VGKSAIRRHSPADSTRRKATFEHEETILETQQLAIGKCHHPRKVGPEAAQPQRGALVPAIVGLHQKE